MLDTADGRVLLKGVIGSKQDMECLRKEVQAAPLTKGLSPDVVFAEDVEGWFVVGVEYVEGRTANLLPDSPDLPLIAEAMETIASQHAATVESIVDRWRQDWWGWLVHEYPRVAKRWSTAALAQWATAAPELVGGDRLAHTDLHPGRILITGKGVRVLDWSYATAAAPWLDSAYLVLLLLGAGHLRPHAEAWARSLSCCTDLDDARLTAFAAYMAGRWTYGAVSDPDNPSKQRRAKVAREYAEWRLEML